jgi:transcription antitermination factor NusG
MKSAEVMYSGEAESEASLTPSTPQWFAIRTRSRHEKLVASQLEQQGIEFFLPLISRTHRWSDRVKQVDLPLFSGYAFTRLSLTGPDRLRVLRTQGVVNFVGMHGSAIPIPDSQIDDVRQLLSSKVPFRERPFLRIGQKVRIRGGALEGLEGILLAENGDRSLVISIAPIQRSLSVRLDGYDVQPI